MESLQPSCLPKRAALLAAACTVALNACGGGQPAADGSAAPLAATKDASAVVVQAASPQGRLLASNCFQCHGSNAMGGFEEIRGKSAEELIEFLGKPAPANIMAAHAQGYTPAQLSAIAAYLQR
jgi:mono/diheme cytochrome c family protein